MTFESLDLADLQAGKPVDNDLWVQTKDNFDSLNGSIGASALVGSVKNGSFEIDSDGDDIPDNWDFTAYPGGTGAISQIGESHGANCFAIVHPGGASNGGGYLDSDYIECSEYIARVIDYILSDTASARNKVEIRFYTDAKVYISTITSYDATTIGTTPTHFSGAFTPPAGSRFLKIRLIGGFTDTDSAGTTYFGYVSMRNRIVAPSEITANEIAPNAVGQSEIASSAVGQGELKTAVGSVSGSGNHTLPGGTHGFYPQVKTSSGSASGQLATLITNTSYVTNVYFAQPTSSVQQRYFQSSPPYKIGNIAWGHFLFVLRNISTGEIVGSYEAEDPPWAYNGPNWGPKDSAERIVAVPHPFADYVTEDPATDGLEIALIDLKTFNMKAWRASPANREKDSIIEDLSNVMSGGAEQSRASLGIPEIPGFTDKVKFRGRS